MKLSEALRLVLSETEYAQGMHIVGMHSANDKRTSDVSKAVYLVKKEQKRLVSLNK